ncbi:Caltractin [Diplonema papillatum]|nr:Caltractin [Diplonema papillatum]
MAMLTDTQLKEVFDLFDANGDGSIDNDELTQIFEALGFDRVPEDELRQMIASVDVDLSGKMEFDEFKFLVKKRSFPADSREEVAAAFAAFAGTDESGNTKAFISVDDLADIAKSINEKVEVDRFQQILNSAPGQPIGQDDEGNSTGLTIVQWREMMMKVGKTKYGKAYGD